MLSVTTIGLREVGNFRNRLARDYGRRRIAWNDFQYLTEHLIAIEDKLVEMAANDQRRVDDDEKKVG
jgi:hypothetical protein